ncbi:MAG TPA: GNAT family N-acetyltransferase, partial [Candidatus Limnocylindria bacterium]
VADSMQGHGVGRQLVQRTLARARTFGLMRVDATLLADNAPMRHLLRESGAHVAKDELDAGVEELALDLTTPALASVGD